MRLLLVPLLLLAGSCRLADYDGDGFGPAKDCNNFDATVYPGAPEVCDGKDDNCNGQIDEGLPTATYYQDADGDGFGNPAVTVTACAAPEGYVANNLDCNDSDAAVSPAATEKCDGIDDNCNGLVDESGGNQTVWYVDADHDGYGSDLLTTTACSQPAGFVSNDLDCNDAAAAAHPSATEVCDGLDDDCNGVVDDVSSANAPVWHPDADHDGYGDPSSSVAACAPPPGYVANGDDCNDGDSSINPDAHELCGGPDMNCDGKPPPLCTSCLDVLNNGDASAGDGLYNIDPDGQDGPMQPAAVWCDMTTDGGGWTMLQRTVWSWDSDKALQTGYDDWYSETLGDPSPGSAYRMSGYAWPFLDQAHDEMIIHYPRATDATTCSPLYYTATGGVITVNAATAKITGVVQNPVLFNAEELSTTDSGPSACGTRSDTVAWFYSNCCSTCPTYQGPFWSDSPHPTANYLWHKDIMGHNAVDACAPKTPLTAEVSANAWGDDSIEVYIR